MATDPASSPWVTIGRHIDIRAPYDPMIVHAMKRLGGRWLQGERIWRLPRASEQQLAHELPDIHRAALRAIGDKGDSIDRIEGDPPTVFAADYLVPRRGAPRHEIVLASRGMNTQETECWVAQLFATDPEKKWVRWFLPGRYDWSAATKRGHGVTKRFLLQEGPVYEVSERPSGRAKQAQRRYLRMWDGERRYMTESETLSCLER